jgi:hypothetical protein
MQSRKALRIIGGRSLDKPEFEATEADGAAIARFLEFALADIKYQFDEMNREPGLSRNDLAEAQATAILLSNYVGGLRSGLDAMKLKETVS